MNFYMPTHSKVIAWTDTCRHTHTDTQTDTHTHRHDEDITSTTYTAGYNNVWYILFFTT